MNLCRTCKYWAVRSDMVGAGNCININLAIKVITRDASGTFITAQNFGCTEHEEGQCTAIIDSPEEHKRKLAEFIDHQTRDEYKQTQW